MSAKNRAVWQPQGGGTVERGCVIKLRWVAVVEFSLANIDRRLQPAGCVFGGQ